MTEFDHRHRAARISTTGRPFRMRAIRADRIVLNGW